MRGRGACLAVVLALGGCAGLDRLNGFAAGPAGPPASPCEVAIAGAATPRDMFSDTRAARMTTGGDGWCGWTVRLVGSDGIAYGWDRAEIARAPAHGEVRVRRGPGLVHIEYRPAPGYRGADRFALRLAPGLALRRASVEVVAPAPGPAVPATVITSTRWMGRWLYPRWW
ncbi:MAG: hypothetical protein KGK10_09660 [Rhodospirillales bacterium]|nr:hypothetical protein [Rhodospirillales bacterium]